MDENKDIVEIYTLQDEEGKEHEFQLLATCEKTEPPTTPWSRQKEKPRTKASILSMWC